MDLSIVIPAHNEQETLNRTINNIYETAKGRFEVIVILNGHEQKVDPRAVVIRNKENLGIRVAVNQGVRVAKGKYIFRIDGHCDFSPDGWDLMLMEVTKPRTMTIPALTGLTKDFVRRGNKHMTCRLTPRMTEEWYGLQDPCTIEPNMCHTGCGMMFEKAFYDSFGGLDEALPGWGRDGAELSVHAWLDGDGMFTRTDVILGHIFRRDKGYSRQFLNDAEKALVEKYGKRWAEIAAHFKHWDLRDDVRHPRTSAKRTIKINDEFTWTEDGTGLTDREVLEKYSHRTKSKSNIYLGSYFYVHPHLKNVPMRDMPKFPRIKKDERQKKGGDDYVVGWGEIPFAGCKQGVIESGFFYQAYHFDTIGLYQHCSVDTPDGLDAIDNFEAPMSADKLIFQQAVQTKFPQPANSNYEDFKGIVLALQNPTDRSIRSVSSPEKYYEFVEKACAYYGSRLFLKLHPWNTGDIEVRFKTIASRYNCLIARTDHSVCRNCEFVLVFNSTFSVDCMLRGAHVAQYAPGYFWQNPAVAYTGYRLPKAIETDIEFGRKTCNFLIWRYCFNVTMPTAKWVKMFEHFAASRKLFPMTEEFCYAKSLVRST
jgi:glycosyltransferase involved in cell wall biosynthesis